MYIILQSIKRAINILWCKMQRKCINMRTSIGCLNYIHLSNMCVDYMKSKGVEKGFLCVSVGNINYMGAMIYAFSLFFILKHIFLS